MIRESSVTLEFGGVMFSAVSPSVQCYAQSILSNSRAPLSKKRKGLEILAEYSDPLVMSELQKQNPGLWWRNTYLPVNNLIAFTASTFQVIENFIIRITGKSR
jgi:hypothetical protein